MQLSANTLNILKNFATINSNIVISEGNVLKTMSEAKNVLASATIAETFTGTFGIYDLGEFLSVYNMFTTPDLVFDTEMKSVTIKEGRSAVKYYFSEPENLTFPKKDIVMPSVDLKFTLTNDDLASIRKASAALGCSELVISKDGDALLGTVTDTKNSTSNQYSIELAGSTDLEGFSYVFSIPNFKVLPGNYDVEITNKLISKFVGTDASYFIALEKSSKIGE